MDNIPYESLKNPPPREIFLRFMDKVDIPPGIHNKCWEWKAGKAFGYGQFRLSKSQAQLPTSIASRLIMVWIHGPIQPKLDVDHRICNNPGCCRPSHLVICTHKENLLRPGSNCPSAKMAKRTHCKEGHLLEGSNLMICELPKRSCRVCNNERQRQKRRKAQCH